MKEFICDNDTIEELVEKTKREIREFVHGVEIEQCQGKSGGQKNVLLHGVGFMLSMARKELESDGWTIPYIIDDTESLWGTFKDGIEIVSREDIRIQKYHHVIATIVHIKELFQTYKYPRGGIERKIISYGQYHLCKHYDEYLDVRNNYLTDEKSKYVFNLAMYSQLTTYCNGEMWRVCESEQYFAIPEFDFLRHEHIVDAGAYVGDTLENFLKHSINVFDRYYAFEPNQKQFAALEKRVDRICEEWALDKEIFTLVHAGVGDRDGIISVDKDGTSDFRLDAGKVKMDGDGIEVCSLDVFLNGKKVTFIKADIEGMEMHLIEGAKNIIKVQKPKIAICIYHRPCDLYCIAKKIREINNDYQFMIRSHSKQYEELVLYCF